MSQGYIYFFQAHDGIVKIGRSADPATRLRTLSREAGHRLTVLGVMPSDDACAEETAIHRECDEHHFEGERFHPGVVPMIEKYRPRFLAALPEAQRVLVQSWVSQELYEAVVARAKSEGRSLANWLRHELDKILEAAEKESR